MKGSRRHRRAFAITACTLWLLSVEVLPNLHLGFHDDDHTHEIDGAIARSEHGHEHHLAADSEHDHDPDHEEIDHPIGGGHVAAGYAHRQTALHEPPALSLEPTAIARVGWHIAFESERELFSTSTHRATARGPPAV